MLSCLPPRHRQFRIYVPEAGTPPSIERLTALGVPDGPDREVLESRPVTLAEGRVVDPEEVLGPPVGAKKLVVVGDTETAEAFPSASVMPMCW